MSCHHRKPRAAAPATAPGILQPCAPNCACVACRSTWHRRKAVDRKEFFESTEFFARSRHKLRADRGGTLVDVAGGHGLVGVLAAIFMADIFFMDIFFIILGLASALAAAFFMDIFFIILAML